MSAVVTVSADQHLPDHTAGTRHQLQRLSGQGCARLWYGTSISGPQQETPEFFGAMLAVVDECQQRMETEVALEVRCNALLL